MKTSAMKLLLVDAGRMGRNVVGVKGGFRAARESTRRDSRSAERSYGNDAAADRGRAVVAAQHADRLEDVVLAGDVCVPLAQDVWAHATHGESTIHAKRSTLCHVQ